MLLPDPLKFAQGEVEVKALEGVERVQGNHQVKRAIRNWQLIRIADLEKRLHFLLRVLNAISRNVQAAYFNPGHGLGELIKQKRFATTHIQNAIPAFSP